MATEEIKYINQCICTMYSLLKTMNIAIGAISTKVDGISTELDLSELTNLATDSNTRIQGMQTDLATTKGNTESLSTEIGEVMERATATYNNTQAILSYVKEIKEAVTCSCTDCSNDIPSE